MRAAFADPPYLGCGISHYGDHHRNASHYDVAENHIDLIRSLHEYDGFAYCLSSPTLRMLLPEFDADVRVAAWVKPWCAFKPNVNPAYAWEPVIFRPVRRRGREVATVRDWVSENITMKKGLCGVKPHGFNKWIIDILGLERGDDLVDLFPGSGGMGLAWDEFCGAAVVQDGLFKEAKDG